jgi:hypothetical protein
LLKPLEARRHLLRCPTPDHERDEQLAYPAAIEVDPDAVRPSTPRGLRSSCPREAALTFGTPSRGFLV